jgi:hypothetical protein
LALLVALGQASLSTRQVATFTKGVYAIAVNKAEIPQVSERITYFSTARR